MEDVEKEIRKLEVWLQELEKKRQWILNKIEKIEEKEGNIQLVNVARELNEAGKRFFEINRRISIDTLQALQSGEGGVLDATKINPNILKEYQIAKKELINLQKQENYLKRLLEEEKNIKHMH